MSHGSAFWTSLEQPSNPSWNPPGLIFTERISEPSGERRYTERVAAGLNPALEKLLGEFSRQLSEHYGSRLVELILFGSHARGEAGPDSDIDVAVVLERIDSHAERVWPMQVIAEELARLESLFTLLGAFLKSRGIPLVED